MTLSPRQRFWMKAALFITFPIWVLPFAVGMFLALGGVMIWEAVDDLVDCAGRLTK